MENSIYKFKKEIFKINTYEQFQKLAIEIFRFQAKYNPIYSKFIKLLGINPEKITKIRNIPFLPIEFFKTKRIITLHYNLPDNKFTIFKSSGTTSMIRSKHYVYDIELYKKSFLQTFENFIGKPQEMVIFALLPSYIERRDSSLVFMVNELIKKSEKGSGFYLYNYAELKKNILKKLSENKKILLFGVSFALLEMAKKYPTNFNNRVMIMETGGMKGKTEEITREELHNELKKAFKVNEIYSEYGMTELLSQSYSLANGIFKSPKWKKVLIRDINDPFYILPENKVGGINIIDLANLYSCSFIATADLGKINSEGFQILGRFDNSDIRGCNLLAV